MLDLLIKDKIKSIQTFKDFHALIEKQAQSKICTLRTDNGKEYTSNSFEDYLRQHEIAHSMNGISCHSMNLISEQVGN